MKFINARTVLAALALATMATLTGYPMAGAAAAKPNCVEQNRGKGCTMKEIQELCIPIWFSGKPADPTNPVDKFCRETDPNTLD